MKASILKIILWICQGTLATSLFWASGMKLLKPVRELKETWPWVGETPALLVKATGVLDLAGAIGLICPLLFHIQPGLTALAALGVTMLMISAAVFHIRRGEASQIGINIAFALLALFIAWGRL